MRLVNLYRFQYPQWVGPLNIGALLLKPYTLRARSKCPYDFFLWGYLKEKFFKHRPRSLEDLKERIQQEVESIPPELTRTVMKKFRDRLQQCVANGGSHMSDIIFKTHSKTVFMYFSEIYSILFLVSFFQFLCLQNVGDLYAPLCIMCIYLEY